MKRPWVTTTTGVSVFLSGGAVLVVELLGVRIVSPVFGTGLSVWAALLSTALLALALGAFAGGRLADRRPDARRYFLLVAAAGAAVAAIPLYAPALVPAFEGLGLRVGALFAAVATFLPPLFLLGLLPPFAVRISAPALDRVGRTAGRLYAIGTLGSVAGTLAAGFLLEPVLPIDAALAATGGAVAAAGVAGLLAVGSGGRAAGAAALALAVLFAPAFPAPAPPGDLVFRADTPFSRVEVVDRDGERWLLLDGTVHSHLRPGDPPLVRCSYVRRLALLAGFRPEAESLLVLGAGGGALLPLLEPEDYAVTVVEIDPVVVDVARRRFGTLTGRERVFVEDARTFVRRTRERFDLVALDVCDANRTPEHLSTEEFFRELQGRMTPDGVLGMNAVGPVGGRSLPALERTLREVFANVSAYAAPGSHGLSNVVFFASDGPLELPWVFAAEWERTRASFPGGEVLTDCWNPLNHWNAATARRVRPGEEGER